MQMLDARFYGENDFDWTSVDVIGSPRLTRLTGLYTFECCEGIPDLILSPDIPPETRIEEVSPYDGAVVAGKEEHSLGSEPCVVKSPAPTKAPQIFEILEAWTQPWLHYKNYAFPASPSRTYDLSALGLVKGPLQLQMSASECKDKLKRIKHLKPASVITLVNSVGGLAQDHYNLNDFVGAEVWFRRCINARMSTMWYKPAQTLWACIRVLDCMLRQDRYEEVKTLHLGLHTKLEKILNREHPIIAGSLELRASLLGALGLLADEEIVLRQVLQSRLETLGMTHPATITALENLGCSLARLKRQAKPQLILETAIQLRLQAMKTSKELGNGEREIVEAMSLLTSGLDSSVEHDDGDKILARAHKLLGNAATSKSEPAFAYYYYKARTYKLQGRIPEAETILRGLLRHHGKSMSNISQTVHADVIDMLAEILNTTGRMREATFWLEKLYLLDVKEYGQIHRFTMSSCKKTGFVYARQRQYAKALLFFLTAKEELAVWSAHNGINRSMENAMKCFQEIDTWVEKVKGMRAVAGSLAQVSGLEEAELLGPDDDDRDEMTSHDIPDPLL
jgi:tetratricopeptide (TPR) repeat protein